jgi:hypothetical protein
MLEKEQERLRTERTLYQDVLQELVSWEPEDDPSINARGMSLNFTRGKISMLSREIESLRVAQLCLDGMKPQTTVAGPASPVANDD